METSLLIYFYLFIYDLFNDAANSRYYIASNDKNFEESWIWNMWKEAILFQYFPGGTEVKHGKFESE